MEGTLKSLQNLMKNMGLPIEQAMAALGVSESEQEHYVEMLRNQNLLA